MIKRTILLSATLILLFAKFTFAQVISKDEALNIAEKLYAQINKNADPEDISINEDFVYKSSEEIPALYVFSEKKGGFLILSAEKRAYPILAWADSVQFSHNQSEWPPSLREMVNNWIEQVEYIRHNNLDASPEISEIWNRLKKVTTRVCLRVKVFLPCWQPGGTRDVAIMLCVLQILPVPAEGFIPVVLQLPWHRLSGTWSTR